MHVMLRSLLLGLSIGTLSSARHAKHAALISLHTRRDALRAGGAAGLMGSGLISSPAVATPAASVPPFDPMGPHMMAAASLPEQLIWETETQSFRPPLTIESALAEKPRVVFVGEQLEGIDDGVERVERVLVLEAYQPPHLPRK